MNAPGAGAPTDLWADRRPRSDKWERGTGGVEFRKSFMFKGDAEGLLASYLKDAPGPVVNVCAGASRLGDVRVDLVHPSADVRADARFLPFRDLGTIVMDPPYLIPGPERHRMVMGCLNALRRGGRFILHAPWMPKPTRRLVLEDVRVRSCTGGLQWPMPPVLVSVWTWRAGPPTDRPTRWRRKPDAAWARKKGLRLGALAGHAEVADAA